MKTKYILLFPVIFFVSCATTDSVKDIHRSRAHYQMGVSHLGENNAQKAYVEFRKAHELNPKDKEVLNGLGIVYLIFEDLQKAKDAFTKAIAIDQNYSEAHTNLGVTYGKMGNWTDAVNSFKTALKNPLYRNPELALTGLGEAGYRLYQHDEAISAYREATKRAPDFYRPFYGLALAYNAKGQYGDAANAITRAVELDPLFKGDRGKAIEYFKNKMPSARGEEVKDVADYLEILKY